MDKSHDAAFLKRGTGGNRFIRSNATIHDLVFQIQEQLVELKLHAAENGGVFDLGKVTIDTMRANNGAISVTVAADLYSKEDT